MRLTLFSLPETVDGGDGESHDCGHAPHDEDGHPHHPHDLVLARLQEVFRITLPSRKKYIYTHALHARIAFVT
jgi:hypothetical protein